MALLYEIYVTIPELAVHVDPCSFIHVLKELDQYYQKSRLEPLFCIASRDFLLGCVVQGHNFCAKSCCVNL